MWLAEGDLLVIFSDGLSEAQNAAGEEYGEERLSQLAGDRKRLAADEIREAIFEDIEKWSGQQERRDDQTLLVLKVTGQKEQFIQH